MTIKINEKVYEGVEEIELEEEEMSLDTLLRGNKKKVIIRLKDSRGWHIKIFEERPKIEIVRETLS